MNVLVDMTAVAADISVRQMRGRSLRLDPGDPDKLASNWDIVCVAPTLGRGHADYGRFVLRHSHLHAPCEDGTIESGPSHVHPELSPYGPPSEDRFMAINVEQQDRAGDRDAARERWGVGLPYRGVDLDALVVRGAACAGDDAPGSVALKDVAPLGRGWWAAPLAFVGIGARRRYPAALPPEWATAAVCEAYVALGELSAEAMATTQFAVRPEGWGADQPARRLSRVESRGKHGGRRAAGRKRVAAVCRVAACRGGEPATAGGVACGAE